MGVQARPLADRFAEKIRIDPGSGCWLWTASTKQNGYGQIGAFGTMVEAHRVSWIIHCGPVPAGMQVLHECDVKTCVNPDHLFLGTAADNIADMDRKGRRRTVPVFGEAHYAAKLTADQATAIRLDPRSQTAIARAYGISQGQVSRIKRGTKWRHLLAA